MKKLRSIPSSYFERVYDLYYFLFKCLIKLSMKPWRPRISLRGKFYELNFCDRYGAICFLLLVSILVICIFQGTWSLHLSCQIYNLKVTHDVIFLTSVRSIVMNQLQFLILIIYNLFFLISLTRVSLVFIDLFFSKA